MKFADPKNDLVFKKIFGDENHKNILISLYNSILGDTNANKYMLDFKVLDFHTLAIEVFSKNGENVLVKFKSTDNRLNMSVNKNLEEMDEIMFLNNRNLGDFDYVMNIFILSGSLIFKHKANYTSFMFVSDKYTMRCELKYFDCILELSQMNKDIYQLSSMLDKWIYFLKNASNLTMIPKEYKNIKEFEDAFNIITQITLDTKDLRDE